MALRTIDPSESYDRKNFTKFMTGFSDLGDYVQALDKNPTDSGARKDLAGMLYDDPAFYAGMASDTVTNEGKEAQSDLTRKICGWVEKSADGNSLVRNKGYVEKNIDEFYGKLTGDELAGILDEINLYKTGDEKFDKVIKLVKERKKIAQAQENGQIAQYVIERMQKAPEWRKQAFFGYGIKDESYLKRAFQSFANATEMEFQKSLKNGREENDKEFIASLIKKSLKIADEQYDDETNLGDKRDIFDVCIAPYYLALAKKVFPKEKKAQKEEDDPDREARKKARRELEMPK